MAVSMSDLRARLRRATDTESATDRHPDTDLNLYINAAYKEYRRLVKVHVPDEAFHTSSTVTTTANVSTVSLPTDIVSLLGVSYLTEGEWYEVGRYEFDERDDGSTESSWSTDRPRYRLRASTLHLVPTPDGAYRMRIHYVAALATVTTGGSIPAWDGFEDFLITAAAVEVAQKDQDWEMWDRLWSRKQQQAAELESLATRDLAKPPKITMTRRTSRWYL